MTPDLRTLGIAITPRSVVAMRSSPKPPDATVDFDCEDAGCEAANVRPRQIGSIPPLSMVVPIRLDGGLPSKANLTARPLTVAGRNVGGSKRWG